MHGKLFTLSMTSLIFTFKAYIGSRNKATFLEQNEIFKNNWVKQIGELQGTKNIITGGRFHMPIKINKCKIELLNGFFYYL